MEELETEDLLVSSEDLDCKIIQLENDNQKLREEFDVQRAKLKDLFLQKEGELERKNKDYSKVSCELNELKLELEDAKNQLVVAGLTLKSSSAVEKRKMEEIASLQQLVHETVEESSSSKTIYSMELKKLYGIIEQLENQNKELKTERQQSPHRAVQDHSSLAPSVMLSAVTKTLARKLGGDSFSAHENMEDSMRKAQEDVEVLRSLVVPLEEEIKALKDKLRSTDEQLQKCQHCKHSDIELQGKELSIHNANQNFLLSNQLSTSTNTSFDGHHSLIVPCDMCSNYETELVKEQKFAEDIKAKLLRAEKSAERHREELLKEIGFRKEMEEKWNEKREQHKIEVAELTTRTDCTEQDLKELQDFFKQTCEEVKQHLGILTSDRQKVQQELEKLQRENDDLVGKYSIHSQQLQSEVINLPNTVEELQELVLKAHQDLIIAKIGKEVAEGTINSMSSDILVLKDQMMHDQEIRESMKNSYATQIITFKAQNHQLQREKRELLATGDKLESLDRIHQATLVQIDELSDEKRLLEDNINELKARVVSLQQELDNSETVQKDFVRLSQSLQVQLEKIRDSDTQVRWQFEEDVEECPSCHSVFNEVKRKKQHCRHCGQIFCTHCLSHCVLSGPNQRPSQVCDVCHTLLVKSSAPYFSTEVPHSPD